VQGYGVFKSEAQKINSEYSPKTVTTDGWEERKKRGKRYSLPLF
jgi:hypothetical protein